MKKSLTALSELLNKLAKSLIGIILALAFLFTVYQVISRYILHSSILTKLISSEVINSMNLPWSEELVRYLFIWTSFLGATVVYKMKGHATVEVLTSYLTGKWKLRVALLVEFINCLFFLILIIYGLEILKKTNGQLSASLQINMAWMYFSIICCAVICLIHSVVFILNSFEKAKSTDIYESSMMETK